MWTSYKAVGSFDRARGGNAQFPLSCGLGRRSNSAVASLTGNLSSPTPSM